MSNTISSDWKEAYSRYRELEKELSVDLPENRYFSFLLRKSVEESSNFKHELAKYRQLKFIEPSADMLSKFSAFAELRSRHNRKKYRFTQNNPIKDEFIFDDAYHLAFHKIPYWRQLNKPVSSIEERPNSLYRGQSKKKYDLEAGIYRNLNTFKGKDEKEVELLRRAAKACEIGKVVAHELNVSFEEGMAIAQHFYKELCVPTWLLDFTWNPWVGLFFATSTGITGETGVVWEINRKSIRDTPPGRIIRLVN